jgi:hypothetical protein
LVALASLSINFVEEIFGLEIQGTICWFREHLARVALLVLGMSVHIIF